MMPEPGSGFRHSDAKLCLDFGTDLTLAGAMMLNDDEIGELPRRMFALAGRSLEHAVAIAGASEARDLAAQRRCYLVAEFHSIGQNIMAITNAIAALARKVAP